jgi:hypothetical protein
MATCGVSALQVSLFCSALAEHQKFINWFLAVAKCCLKRKKKSFRNKQSACRVKQVAVKCIC